ncbi:MAG: hypothetical protein LBQ46_13115, partial [Treponema sp.]|nr:hypothetical protein [Treponema sp.]
MAAEISEPRRGLTFEDVWVAIMADREEQRERHREIDRIMQETERMMQETSRKMQETDRMMKETSRRMQETDRKIGELGNRFGELAEHLVAPSITEKF